MGSGFEKIYQPDKKNAELYQSIYKKYNQLADFIENEFTA
jgi:hypothetical protein